MRDQHRSKQEIINEVVGLRKQVTDLRDAMATHRRVEDALRQAEEKLRALADGAPVGLCLVRSDGIPLAANRPFARLLGYESPAELLSVAQVLGVFARSEELSRLIQWIHQGDPAPVDPLLRQKSGEPLACWVMASISREPDAVALVVLEPVSVASSGDTRPASVRCNA